MNLYRRNRWISTPRGAHTDPAGRGFLAWRCPLGSNAQAVAYRGAGCNPRAPSRATNVVRRRTSWRSTVAGAEGAQEWGGGRFWGLRFSGRVLQAACQGVWRVAMGIRNGCGRAGTIRWTTRPAGRRASTRPFSPSGASPWGLLPAGLDRRTGVLRGRPEAWSAQVRSAESPSLSECGCARPEGGNSTTPCDTESRSRSAGRAPPRRSDSR